MESHLRAVKNVTLDDLKKYNLIYLATPYTLYAKGLDAAAEEASSLAGALLDRGIRVYCPIAYGHALTTFGGVNPLSEDIWYPFNDAFLAVSDCLLIGRMMGWQSSKGVGREIDNGERHKKPVYHINPETLEVY